MLKPFDTGVCQYDETAAGKVRRSVRGSHFGPWHRKYEDNSDESRTDDGRRQPFARWRDAALVWSTTERPHGWTRSLINLAYRFLGPSPRSGQVHDRAFLVILESMTPAERVSFLLHDVFEHPPPTSLPSWVARLKPVDSSPLRRACGFGEPSRSPVPTAERARLVRSFKQAWEAKDIDALIGLLDPSATAVADGGGHVTAALQPVEGERRSPAASSISLGIQPR